MPTKRFNDVMPDVFLHEGGYNDIKEDRGSVTNFGVSLAFAKTIGLDLDNDGDTDWLDIKLLTKKHATEIYWNNFWRPMYDKMPAGVGEKVFDTAINAGHSRSHKILQQAMNSLGEKMPVDGLIGSTTMGALAKYPADKIVDAYCAQQAVFYKGIVASNPSQEKFLRGWLNRAAWKFGKH